MFTLRKGIHGPHLLVVTRPAPESTSILLPEVVTPNAAKTVGTHARNAKARGVIAKTGNQKKVDGLELLQAYFYIEE